MLSKRGVYLSVPMSYYLTDAVMVIGLFAKLLLNFKTNYLYMSKIVRLSTNSKLVLRHIYSKLLFMNYSVHVDVYIFHIYWNL